ncbi:MAG: mannitol dehydrogenase family protein, partial [Sphaerochaetaceae bacterium]|nr:mannitol dehydrogenase family protein [Sphaerochaetaceae bacterium]
LEKAGVYFTNRDTVTKVERMKVCTCLNPLHTAMSLMGCLLGYTRICDEMKDEDIVAYIKRLGYVEGLPVVTDPGILSPKSFIDDVVYKRLPNPFMPDTPQRIATDTSQKLAIRFGETYKEYKANGLDLANLKAIPVVLASFIRYILGVDDNGQAFELSPDPLLESVQADVASVKFGQSLKGGELDKILSREEIWGYNVLTSPLKDAVISAFESMNAGVGAVRKTLHKVVEG